MPRWLAVTAAITMLMGSALFSALPVGASHAHAIDPTLLRVPGSAFPAGAVIDHDAVSNNVDADGAPSPDGHPARTYQLHHQLYEVLGRITGYRLDVHYTAGDATIEMGYLASIFASADKAGAAMNDAVGPDSIIAFVGHKLPTPCTSGDRCEAYYGPNPNEPGMTAEVVIFTRGPILVEAAAQVPSASFAQLETSVENTLYGLSAAVDTQARRALGTPPGGEVAAPTATSTLVPPAPPATPSVKSKKRKQCRKGYKLKHGKCKKVRKP